MQLLCVILKKTSAMPAILSAFLDAGVSGTTVVDCSGGLSVLSQSDIEPPPIFGSLRQLLRGTSEEAKLLLTVLSDEQVKPARDIVDKCIGGLSRPDTGILFTMPLSYVEGLAKEAK